MAILSMSHDQNVFHAMLGKTISKSLSLKLIGQSPMVLGMLIRDMGLRKYFQMMVLGCS